MGIGELAVIVVVAALVFGPSLFGRFGRLGKSLKGGVDNFREASGLADDEEEEAEDA